MPKSSTLKEFGERRHMGNTKIYEEINSGDLRVYKVGKLTRISDQAEAGKNKVPKRERNGNSASRNRRRRNPSAVPTETLTATTAWHDQWNRNGKGRPVATGDPGIVLPRPAAWTFPNLPQLTLICNSAGSR